MPFAITPKDISAFHKSHFVEFEEMLDADEVLSLRAAIDETLSNRLGAPASSKECDALYMAGRDLWRDHPLIKKIALRKNFAEMASQLLKKKPLKIAYDQVLQTPNHPKPLSELEKLPPFFHEVLTLNEGSCIQGVLGALVLHISSHEENLDTPSLSIKEGIDKLCPIPQKPGSGVFISSDTPLFFEDLFALPRQTHMMIVYCENKAIYRCENGDGHAHDLKKLGYVFGDSLRHDTHPVLYT